MNDLLPDGPHILRRACDSTAAILHAIQTEDLDRPTPCASWNVQDVVNHMIGGMTYFAEIAETGQAASNDEQPGPAAGDLTAAFQREADRLVAAFSAPGAMEKVMQMPIGDLPGSVCVWIAAGDIFTHGWDLAKALGLPGDLEPDVAARLLAQIQPMLPDSMRGPEGEAPFGPRVEIGASAPAADRLAAFEGRHP